MESTMFIVSLIVLVISIVALVKFFELCADVKRIRDILKSKNPEFDDYERDSENIRGKFIDKIILVILAILIIGVIIHNI